MTVSRRDHRIDFLRGAALASIFINHVPGNIWEQLTHKNFGFSDAAEIFVLWRIRLGLRLFCAIRKGRAVGSSTESR
jgi:hypothetical protein